MSVRIEQAIATDLSKVLPLLAGFRNPRITEAHWRRLFDYAWPVEELSRGWILRDDAEAVGFFGTLWSEREIDGRRERICNLTSWITLPAYRHHAMRLLQAVLTATGCTITCHTPAPALYPLYRRLGFTDLETHLRILLPRPAGQHLRDWVRCRATTDPARIAQHLHAPDVAILVAHLPLQCGHLLVWEGERYCYIVWTRTRGKRFPFAHLHYVSHAGLFSRNLDRIRLHLAIAARTPLVMIDERLTAGMELPHSRSTPLGHPHVYRSTTLAPGQVDNLYSELVVLGL